MMDQQRKTTATRKRLLRMLKLPEIQALSSVDDPTNLERHALVDDIVSHWDEKQEEIEKTIRDFMEKLLQEAKS